MKRITTAVGVAAIALAVCAGGAHAKRVACQPPGSFHGSLSATNLSCEKARSVIRAYFRRSSRGPDDITVGGFDCNGSYTRRGPKVGCRAGKRRISYRAPRR